MRQALASRWLSLDSHGRGYDRALRSFPSAMRAAQTLKPTFRAA
jgi:hypothetical protein